MANIKLHDNELSPYIKAEEIDRVIEKMAGQMNEDLKDSQPLFLSILNGSFMFTSDLIKQITIPGTAFSFVIVASYSGTTSSGEVNDLIGLKEDITGKTIVILEDIIDSGKSMSHLLQYLKS